MIRAGVPPPPSEVKIRTMHSDLESMAKSGGGMPTFQNVAVDNLSIEKEYATPDNAPAVAPVAAAEPAAVAAPVAVAQSAVTQPAMPAQYAQPTQAIQPPPQQPISQIIMTTEVTSPRKDIYPILIVAVVALLAIGGVSYFAYITFFAGSSSQAPSMPAQTASLPAVATTTPTSTASTSGSSPAVVTPTSSTNSQPPAVPLSDELSSPHISLFVKPADQVITIDFTGTTPSTYQKTMLSSLSTANSASSMIEINPKTDNNNLSIQGLTSIAGAPIFNSQALASFDPDATFFVYRDKLGLWPGYVIALGAGETSSSVGTAITQLEQSANIGNLFLTNPGAPSSDGFTDSVTAGIPVRVLPFSGTSFPLYFSYGWYGNDLILSTSNNGFAAAVAAVQ